MNKSIKFSQAEHSNQKNTGLLQKEKKPVLGRLHSMETMGLVDGPGTRTIFFMQGCPIRCLYCHNPDTQTFKGGEIITPEEVLRRVKRYIPYYGDEGGVTFSGGESLAQGEFIYECLKLLKENNINTCLDTSGFGQPKYYPKIFPLVDTMLLDVKAFNSERFKALTKGNFSVYLDFINKLSANGFKGALWIRHVMVPGFTDNEHAMEEFIRTIMPIRFMVERIEILPYHTGGVKKYRELGIPYELEGVKPMDKKKAKELEIYANNLFAGIVHQGHNETSLKKKEGFMKNYIEIEKDDLAKMITKLPLLEDINPKNLDNVIDEIRLFEAKKDDYIFRSGDTYSHMYLIVEGRVKIYYNSIDGKEQIFYVYTDGDFVGGLNILEHTEYLYMGQALTDCKVIEIPKKTFNERFMKNTTILVGILHKCFERIRWAEDLIQTLSTSNASMKTAALLLRLKNSIGVETDEGIKLELAMNREELGNYSGLTRETITRKLGEFKELGYIDLVGNKIIIIKDLDTLEDLVF